LPRTPASERGAAERFALRCEATVARVLAVEHDAVVTDVAVRRRTRERLVSIPWDHFAHAPIPPSCESCGLPSRAFHACDAAAPLVCPTCVGPHCPACATARD
jgi:hypothetical protein